MLNFPPCISLVLGGQSQSQPRHDSSTGLARVPKVPAVPNMWLLSLPGAVLRPITGCSSVCLPRLAPPTVQRIFNSRLLASTAETHWLFPGHSQQHKRTPSKRVCAALPETAEQIVDPAEYLADSLEAFQTSAGLVDQVSEDESEVSTLTMLYHATFTARAVRVGTQHALHMARIRQMDHMVFP